MLAITSNASEPNASETIMPYYNNVSRTSTSFEISSGEAHIITSFSGYPGVTQRVEITTTLYVSVGVDWIEHSNWYDESTRHRGTFNHTIEVESGTYKVFVEYRLYGSGGDADVITYEKELTN